jgi:DNA-binding MarR family transcriptional regulator
MAGGSLSAQNKPTPIQGEPFSPYKRFLCALVPRSLLRNRDIRAEDKLLLALLYAYAGKKDYCFVSVETLANECGVTADSMSRSLTRLSRAGFIRRERKARAVAITRLLFHRALVASIRPNDPTPTPDRTPTDEPMATPDHDATMIRRARRDDPASRGGTDPTLTPDAHKEEVVFSEVVQEVDSSSSSTALPVEKKTRSDESISEENMEALRTAWRAAYFTDPFTSEGIQRPTRQQTLKAIAQFERGVEEMAVYLEHFPSRKLKPKSYEYLFRDVADFWPDIKRDLEAEVQREQERVAAMRAAQAEREAREDRERAVYHACREKGWKSIYSINCQVCAGFGRNPYSEEVCTCSAGTEYLRLQSHCEKCGSSGYALQGKGTNYRYAWCDCSHAQSLKQREPSAVENYNADLDHFKSSKHWGGRNTA